MFANIRKREKREKREKRGKEGKKRKEEEEITIPRPTLTTLIPTFRYNT